MQYFVASYGILLLEGGEFMSDNSPEKPIPVADPTIREPGHSSSFGRQVWEKAQPDQEKYRKDLLERQGSLRESVNQVDPTQTELPVATGEKKYS